MSLRWRIVLALAAIAAAVGALAATGAYLTTAHQLESSIDDSLVAGVESLNGFRSDRPEPGRDGDADDRGAAASCPPPGVLQPASAAQLVSASGAVTTCIEGSAALPVDEDDVALASSGGVANLETVSVEGSSYRVLTAPWHEGGVIQVARDLAEMRSVLAALRARLALLTAAGVVAAAVLGWLVARRIVRPVIRLTDVAESIATTQDLTTPIPVEGDGEVGSLSRSFTTMVQALATSREQQQRLITDASHEMRTPLTSLRTNLELLEQLDRLPVDERREVLEAVQLDVAELTHMLTELVELASDRSDDEVPEPTRLADLAADVVARFRRRPGRSISLDVDGASPAPDVVVRSQMVERAISNLVDNALKYSPPGTAVEVVVHGGRVEVLDRGPGIPAEDQDRVFERFYRSTVARTEPGSGLGLAIVAQIVERHRGRVWATNRPGGGACVGFELPVAGGGPVSTQ